MENNSIEEIAGMKVYNSAEELSAAMSQPQEEQTQEPVQQEGDPQEPVQEQTTQETVQEEQYVQPEGDPQGQVQNEQPEYSQEDVESAVFSFLSERLGREISTMDDLQQTQNQMDERLESIARFVEDTGRSPEDWFAYQSLNPSEMDDITAVRVHMASEYPNLAQDELNLLIQSKYKMDPELNTDEEVRLSQIQLKVDAENARRDIDELRNTYKAPEVDPERDYSSVIDDDWISKMSSEVDSLEALEFDLGDGNSFNFGLDEKYKSQLKQKNSNLENYFDDYIRGDGSWDFDKLSSHRAVVDNIDFIVSSAYKQGLGDGQRNIVNKAANVQNQAPADNGQQANPLADQLRNIMGGQSNKLTFKI